MAGNNRSAIPFQNQEPDLTASDPYRVLGVMSTASQAEIKRTYFGLIRQYSPETAPEQFKIIRGAYEKIKDVSRRAETDIFLPYPPPAWQPPDDMPSFDLSFNPSDALFVIRHWGDLGRTDFREDFEEIDL